MATVYPHIGELVDLGKCDGVIGEFPTDDGKAVFALAQVMKSTAEHIGDGPLAEQVKLKAVRLIYDAQNPGFEGNAG